MGSQLEREALQKLIADGQALLLFVASGQDVDAVRDLGPEGWSPLHISDDGRPIPLLAPLRVIIHRPTLREKRFYQGQLAARRLSTLAPFLPVVPPGPGAAFLIDDVDAFLANPQADEVPREMRRMPVPIAALSKRGERYNRLPLSYLSTIWETSSEDEGTVLRQIAFTGLVVPHRKWEEALRELTLRGILDPEDLSIHPELGSFVRRVTPNPDVVLTAQGDSVWEKVKAPLVAAVLSLCAAFGISEPHLALGSLLAPSGFVGLPVLLRLVFGMGKRTE